MVHLCARDQQTASIQLLYLLGQIAHGEMRGGLFRHPAMPVVLRALNEAVRATFEDMFMHRAHAFEARAGGQPRMRDDWPVRRYRPEPWLSDAFDRSES